MNVIVSHFYVDKLIKEMKDCLEIEVFEVIDPNQFPVKYKLNHK